MAYAGVLSRLRLLEDPPEPEDDPPAAATLVHFPQSHRRKSGPDMVDIRAYPEGIDYKDTGCNLHPACLTCPLPRCRYDRRPETPAQHRGREIVALLEEGHSASQVARQTGVSRRTVFRWKVRGTARFEDFRDAA